MSHKSVVFAVTLFGFILHPSLAAGRFARIKGGTEADIAEFRWTVSIKRGGVHQCGGAIINPKTILTAAHCVINAKPHQLVVRVGSKYHAGGGQLFSVISIAHHDQFDFGTSDYDAAVVRLSVPITLSRVAKAIPLARSGSMVSAGDYGYFVGWGHTNPKMSSLPEVLQSLRVMILEKKLCQVLLRKILSESMLCAGEPDPNKITCGGDSGGPLTVDGVLVGIASNGPKCRRPDVFTKVAAIRPWVEKYLRQYHEVL